MLVHEVLSRPMRNRKAVAHYAGLTGAPDERGAKRRNRARQSLDLQAIKDEIARRLTRWEILKLALGGLAAFRSRAAADQISPPAGRWTSL
jgi:transposase